MDPKRDGPAVLLAPLRTEGAVLSFPAADRAPRQFPPVDEHIVKPEVTRDEVIRGRKVIAQPALAPHGDAHSDLAGLVRWHVRDGYRSSLELLTRVSEGSNFATDLSVRRVGNDPATGQRYLEELSFEVVSEQAMRDIREKAEDLTLRGVRRVIAVFVKRGEVCEWSRDMRNFVPLDPNDAIEDPCLVRPVAVRALVDAAVAESEAVRALEKRGSPEIVAIKEQGRRAMFREFLQERFGDLPDTAEARIAAASGAMLSGWVKRLHSARTIDDIFTEE